SPYDRSFLWSHLTGGMVGLVPNSFRAVGISRDGRFSAGGNLGRAARLNLSNAALVTLPHVAIAGLTTDTDLAWAAIADGYVIVGMMNLSQFNGFFGRAFM